MPDQVGHDGDGDEAGRAEGRGSPIDVGNDEDGIGVGNDGDGVGVAGDGRRTFHCFNEFYVYLQVVWRDVSTFYERST